MASLFELERYFDVAAWLAARGVAVDGAEVLLDCPQCGKRKLSVNVERRKWHCWVCASRPGVGQSAGGMVALVEVVEGVGRAVAEAILAKYGRPPVGTGTIAGALDPGAGNPPQARIATPIPYPPTWQPCTSVLPYMAERRITLADAQEWGLGFCTGGVYANRLIFPVFEGGQLVYYQGRAMWPKPPGDKRYRKSLNPPGISGMANSGDLLMNLDRARNYPRVAVTEGPMDCLRTGPDAVCTFGKQISPAQVGRLLAAGVRAVDLMWDADAASEIWAAANWLLSYFEVRAVFLRAGDPADHTREELAVYRAAAMSMRSGRRVALGVL